MVVKKEQEQFYNPICLCFCYIFSEKKNGTKAVTGAALLYLIQGEYWYFKGILVPKQYTLVIF